MSDVDLSPITAKDKNNRALNSVVSQVFGFAAVMACAYLGQSDGFIGWMLIAYVGLIIIGTFSMAILWLMPEHFLLETRRIESKTFRLMFIPSATITRYIALIFTVIEVGIFLNVGWLVYAIIWVVAETIQYSALARLRKTLRKAQAASAEKDLGKLETIMRDARQYKEDEK